ncbi:MAG: ATP-binding protein [Chloroflexi bacterium]|nr:ATP-binding protein [Chloroflexota bacterium]
MESEVQGLAQDVAALRMSLPPLPDPSVRPAFILVSGLPGTGKSYFSRRLAEEVPLAVLETDSLRRVLFPTPAYSARESDRLFQAVHELLADLLRRRISVVLDATNLVERHREILYSIGEAASAHLIIVRTEATPSTVRERLEGRGTSPEREDGSEADWRVYQRMRPSQERIRRNHLRVNTAEDIGPVIHKIAREVARWNRV